MLKQTLKIVSYLFGSLLIGIVTTPVVSSTEDVAVEKRIRNTMDGSASHHSRFPETIKS